LEPAIAATHGNEGRSLYGVAGKDVNSTVVTLPSAPLTS
jgi:hypothetical protein